MEKRDSFIFYRSFLDAIKELAIEDQNKVFMAICEYALNQGEIKLEGIGKAIFILIKPQLDANYKKYENGKKRKSTSSGNGISKKQSISKTEANSKQNISKGEANGNANENLNPNHNREREITTPSLSDRENVFYQKVFELNAPDDDLLDFYNYWSESDVQLEKMKWELEKTWDIKKRLKSWLRKKENFNKNGKNEQHTTTITRSDDAKEKYIARYNNAYKRV